MSERNPGQIPEITAEPSDAYLEDMCRRWRDTELSKEIITQIYRENVSHIMQKMGWSQQEAEELENAHLNGYEPDQS